MLAKRRESLLSDRCRRDCGAPSLLAILAEALFDQAENRPVVLGQQPGPDAGVALREIYTAEKHPHDQVHDLIINGLTLKPIDRPLVILRAVGSHPRLIQLNLCLINAHLERRVGHFIMRKIHPVLWTRQSSLCSQFLVSRCAWQRHQRAEYRHSRRPVRDLLQSSLSHSGSIVIKAKDE